MRTRRVRNREALCFAKYLVLSAKIEEVKRKFDLLNFYLLLGDKAIYAYDCLVKSTPREKVSARRALVLIYDICL